MTTSHGKNLTRSDLFFIACIGASAGGLEALIALFSALPKKINIAFVLIQHLEPQHKSALADILSRETSLSICEAKNNTVIRPSHVYVIPPNTLMAISHRRLKITVRTKRSDGRYLPVDFFMASLAEDAKEKAIGIILSGTGSDGAQGACAIKAKGGVVFAQNERTAHYFGMPGSAIACGAADFVLGPKEIARKLVYMGARGDARGLPRTGIHPAAENGLAAVLVLLRDLVGVDFMHYKQTTIRRRVDLRMAFHAIKTHAGYYEYLKDNPSEATILLKNILISVTAFFRDPEVFAALRRKVFPCVVHDRLAKDPIRVWVPACSSGEEVYSLAIALYEFLETSRVKPPVQIFGTDLSAALIEKARAGVYPYDISAQVSRGRLRRFFARTDSGYRIAKHIRDLCVFAKHDLITDPPLSNMDIESCRNLLIYLDGSLQNKALSMLHYSLKPKGFLVLGTSESVTAVPAHFCVVNKKYKIYSKIVIARKLMPAIKTPDAALLVRPEHGVSKKKVRMQREADMPRRIPPQTKAVAMKRSTLKTAGIDAVSLGDSREGVAVLKKEFARTVERLHAISEEKDTFNEELRAANEEIQSSNEELQSMNEELETSKEELQSTNEELLTLNDELQNKNAELTHLNSDLSNVFSSTGIPIIIVGNDLRIKRFTPTARKVMNLIPTDVERPIGDIKLNIEISNLEEMILGVIEDMVSRESEVRDKEGRWHSVRIRPYRTIDNKIDGAIIALIDIDDIKRSREEAQGALDYTQAIIETMRESMVVLDKTMHILSANRSFCAMFGVQASEVRGKLFNELGGYRWDNPQLRNLLEKIAFKKSHFNDFELFFNFPVIGEKVLLLNGRQIKWHDKDVPLILLVIEDITKRKKAEDILKRDNKTLDIMVSKRSRELLRLQMELVKSRHLSAIGTMAATVAHELRNPLADIALSVYRIKKIIKDPSVEKILTGIGARVLESDQIINNILMYSKTAIAHYEFVKVNDILKSSIDEEAQKFPAGKISIIRKLERTKDLCIEVDPVRIKEVFRNILHNAFEALRGDTGMLEIASEATDSTVTILIKDNGEGIARKDLKNVTSPFFTTKAKGTGLGLAVCTQVAMLHGGSIDIKSAKGKGTTVTVTLPIHKQKDA